jgi:dihydroorotate dehydrogenase (NAD+) catalytic subunit
MNKGIADLSVVLGKIRLQNPVMPSSGTFGYGSEFADFVNLEDLGAVIVKGTTLSPRIGNFQNRYTEISGCGFLSCVGLQNVGVERLIKDKLPYLREIGTPVIVNMACESTKEFVKMTEILTNTEGIAGLEVNMCCPNVEGGGKSFSADPDVAFGVLKAVRDATDLTIIAKVTATVIDATILAKVCEEAGADAICPGFGPMGMAIDIHTRRSKLGKNLMGALGGPALKAVAVRLVWEAIQVVHIPVIGCGGITGAEDALEFFIAGATAVEIGAYNLIDPQVIIKTIEGIRKYLIDHGMNRMSDIRGSLILS